MEKPVGRVLGPAFALALVVAGYTAIAVFGKGRSGRGDLLKDVGGAVQSMKKDVGSSVEQLQNKVETLQKQLPSQIESARKTVEGLQDQVQKATQGQTVPDKTDDDKKN